MYAAFPDTAAALGLSGSRHGVPAPQCHDIGICPLFRRGTVTRREEPETIRVIGNGRINSRPPFACRYVFRSIHNIVAQVDGK